MPVIELQGQTIIEMAIYVPEGNLMSIALILADDSYLGPYGDQVYEPLNVGVGAPLLYIFSTFDSNIVTGLNFYVAYPLE